MAIFGLSKSSAGPHFFSFLFFKKQTTSCQIRRDPQESCHNFLWLKMAARARITQNIAQSWLGLSKFRRFSAVSAVKSVQSGGSSVYSTSFSNIFDYRHISQLVKCNENRVYLLDTLVLVRSLEAQGISSKHVEAITSAMTLVLDHILENVSLNIISREIQKIEMSREANLCKLKSEIQSSQDHFSLIQHDTLKLIHGVQHERKRLQYDFQQETEKIGYDIEKMQGEMRSEIEKSIAEQCLETSHLENKIAGQIHAVRDKLEVAKRDVLKFFIGSVVSLSAAFIGLEYLSYITGMVKETSQGS